MATGGQGGTELVDVLDKVSKQLHLCGSYIKTKNSQPNLELAGVGNT
jgi:hypothetical protein